MEAHDEGLEHGRQLGRVNAFSDGIFSIAATLLVLSIDLPTGPASELNSQLNDLVEPTFVYFLSFAVIGLFWTRHHRLFGTLHRTDGRFALINLTFLGFIALLPAPTEILGRYGSETAPPVIYAVNILILSGLLRWLYHHAETQGLTDVQAETTEGKFRSVTVLGVFALSIPVAFIDPRAAMYVWILAAVIPRARAKRSA
jgi:uncharacterized membrane protein